jgi:hypothetical protein
VIAARFLIRFITESLREARKAQLALRLSHNQPTTTHQILATWPEPQVEATEFAQATAGSITGDASSKAGARNKKPGKH